MTPKPHDSVDWPLADHAKAVCCVHNHIHVGHFTSEGKMISELILGPGEAYDLSRQLLRAYDLAENLT
jgi:hypothetical protein